MTFYDLASEKALVEKGMIEVNDVEIPDRLGKMILHVPRLTVRGHLLICEWASQQPEEG